MSQPEQTLLVIQTARRNLSLLEQQILNNDFTAQTTSATIYTALGTLNTTIQDLDPETDNLTLMS